ncbi:MAG: PAS domain-containing protein [Hydrogenophaga sp.]|nr:PAS domain-containing protein [Hydrogenophaga sp.]
MDMPSAPDADFATLFHFLPIGAYRSSAEGRMLHANEQLARINGFRDVAELIERARGDPEGWYVDPARRVEFRARLARDGEVRGFVSEVKRRHDGERMWVSENAHLVRDAQGRVLFYEGTVEDITGRMAEQKLMREQQDRLQALADQIPGTVFSLLIRADGTRAYRFVSSGVREMYGFEPEDLMRDPMLIARYRHPDDVPRLGAETQAILAAKVDLAGEFRIVLPDGQVKWLYKRSCEVSRDEEGVQRVGVLLDITARKKAEEALRENEALWKLALESAGEGVWDWNLATGEEYLSDSLLAMYGYSRDDIQGVAADLDARTHPDDIPAMVEARRAHFEGPAPLYRNEHRVRAKDGRWIWVLTRGMVISRDEDGRPLRIVGTHTDITDMKLAEEQQRTLEVQLRESQKMEAIGTLAGGVAHDFNNLLAAILGNLVLAREDVGADHPAQESLAEINRAAIRARQLVQQILTFSRRGAQVMEHQPLLPLVEEALGLMRSLLPAGVRLVTRLSSEPLPALVDGTQLQQVLMNLCTNAWQAFAGRPGEVTVALERAELDAARALQLGVLEPGSYVCLSVADNGPGIDEVTQRRVFEPFFTTKAPGTGTGLGLAVVHGIVKAHRGAIGLTSQPGAGTRFDVYLPLAASAGMPAASVSVAPSAPATPVPAGRHVVYVDDYEALVFLVGRLLRKQGYRVSTFESGEAVIDWLKAHPGEPIDLLVTDQNMPGSSGVEVAREVHRLRPGLRVAIVSGHVSDALIAEAARVGVDDVLAKQDSMDELGNAIRGLLDTDPVR